MEGINLDLKLSQVSNTESSKLATFCNHTDKMTPNLCRQNPGSIVPTLARRGTTLAHDKK